MNNLLTLFDLIGVLARQRYQTAERYFSTLGLNHTEARLLTLLDRENGAATQDALSNMLFVDRSNAGRALKSLEHEGYIERFQSDTDKRTNLVQITARGREAVTEISKLKEKMVQNFFGELNEAEAGQIIDLLRKVYPNEQDA
jgi:MarR family transcriptional regulator, transcriptional regulator for hemolysin